MKFPHAQKKEMKSWKLKIPKTMRGCKRSGDTIFIFLYFLYLQVSVTIISITNSIQAKYFESSVCDQVQTTLTEEILKKTWTPNFLDSVRLRSKSLLKNYSKFYFSRQSWVAKMPC